LFSPFLAANEFATGCQERSSDVARVVKVKGEFVWHKHEDTDDFFLVLGWSSARPGLRTVAAECHGERSTARLLINNGGV
jgi:hypothetical protein